MTQYAFTIKRCKNNPTTTRTHYAAILRKFEKKGDIRYLIYEYDSQGKLHVHGLINLHCKYSELVSNAYTMRFEKIYDLEGWYKYMNKEQLLSLGAHGKTSYPDKTPCGINDDDYSPPLKSKIVIPY